MCPKRSGAAAAGHCVGDERIKEVLSGSCLSIISCPFQNAKSTKIDIFSTKGLALLNSMDILDRGRIGVDKMCGESNRVLKERPVYDAAAESTVRATNQKHDMLLTRNKNKTTDV